MNIMVMVLTIFVSNGAVTTRALVADADKAQCDQDASAIIHMMEGQTISVAGQKLKIEYVDHACVSQTRGQHA